MCGFFRSDDSFPNAESVSLKPIIDHCGKCLNNRELSCWILDSENLKNDVSFIQWNKGQLFTEHGAGFCVPVEIIERLIYRNPSKIKIIIKVFSRRKVFCFLFNIFKDDFRVFRRNGRIVADHRAGTVLWSNITMALLCRIKIDY